MGYSRAKEGPQVTSNLVHIISPDSVPLAPSTHASLFLFILHDRRSFFLLLLRPHPLPRLRSSTTSFYLFVLALPSHRHRRAASRSDLFASARARAHRPRGGVFIFYPARHRLLLSATVCPHTVKFTRHDLHRLAFRSTLVPRRLSSCSCLVVTCWARSRGVPGLSFSCARALFLFSSRRDIKVVASARLHSRIIRQDFHSERHVVVNYKTYHGTYTLCTFVLR